jgi:hypothetical protein
VAAIVFPILQGSDAHPKFVREAFLRYAYLQPSLQQQFAKWLFLFGKRRRIMPYGLDHKMAEWARKQPLPPRFWQRRRILQVGVR